MQRQHTLSLDGNVKETLRGWTIYYGSYCPEKEICQYQSHLMFQCLWCIIRNHIVFTFVQINDSPRTPKTCHFIDFVFCPSEHPWLDDCKLRWDHLEAKADGGGGAGIRKGPRDRRYFLCFLSHAFACGPSQAAERQCYNLRGRGRQREVRSSVSGAAGW